MNFDDYVAALVIQVAEVEEALNSRQYVYSRDSYYLGMLNGLRKALNMALNVSGFKLGNSSVVSERTVHVVVPVPFGATEEEIEAEARRIIAYRIAGEIPVSHSDDSLRDSGAMFATREYSCAYWTK